MKKVLVVDDNEDERSIAGSLLRHFGYDVVLADGGVAGVAMARQEKPAVILMDIMMPGVSGFTAVEVLRHNRETRGIPVVAISLYDPRPEEIREAGFDEFLPKPFTPEALLDVVGRLS